MTLPSRTDKSISRIHSQTESLVFCRNHKGENFTFDAYLERVRTFHGHVAPGLVLGGRMVTLAMDHLPAGILFDVFSETSNCLPDAVQILTPCTIGNGWLRITPLGRFALSLFDKTEGSGIRISIDTQQLASCNEIQTWFLKLKPKNHQDPGRLLQQIREAGDGLFRIEEVRVRPCHLEKQSLGPKRPCPLCNEYYPAKHGALCRGCQGESPYVDWIAGARSAPIS